MNVILAAFLIVVLAMALIEIHFNYKFIKMYKEYGDLMYEHNLQCAEDVRQALQKATKEE